ncbi:MAG: G5 domain-containing protein [Bacilli bacterium]
MEKKKGQSQIEVKKNKKALVIVIVAIVLVGSLIALTFVGRVFKTKDTDTKEEIKNEEANLTPPEKVPAANTEELKQMVSKVEVKEVTKDKIIFNTDAKIKVGDKVAVWIYSEPKFLGYFEVKEENGQKIIEGLQEKLAELEIDAGEHNIAITTEEGEEVGYFDVVIEENGELKEEVKPIVKEVVETEIIKFTTETKTTESLVKGTQKIAQEGINGEKEITYEVTYDADGNEISRKKVSEKITKVAVNQIVEKGTADYSLSNDKITNTVMGFFCLTTEKTEYGCNYLDSLSFSAIEINGQYYAKCTSDDSSCVSSGFQTPTKITKTSEGLTATINGKNYYFDQRAGSNDLATLTIEKCNEYKLVCAN